MNETIKAKDEELLDLDTKAIIMNQNGEGEETSSDGAMYKGNYVNGKKHTVRSTYTWADGNTYTGEFAYDQLEGKGV